MPAFRRIVCAVDSSAAGGEAARQATLLAHSSTEISLLEVEEDVNVPVLLAQASADADLLVVGARGGSGGDVLLGSTASAAVHSAPVSVLVARPAPQGSTFPRDILAATDGSPDAARGVELAGLIASAHAGSIALIHVSEGSASSESTLDRDATQLGNAVALEPKTIEEYGRAAGRIAEVAGRERVSLLVIGSRGLGGARLLGSVGEHVAHTAPCSVLVARPRA